jgi:hypothetical protein
MTLTTAPLKVARCLVAALGLCGILPMIPAAANTTATATHAAPTAQPGGLGTVFFSPAQRQRITQARRGIAASDDAVATGAVRLDGLVRNGRGMATAFINGQEAGPQLASTGAALNIEAQGVRLDARTRLVVGQSVVPGAGNAPMDLVPAGSVVSGAAQRAEAPPAAGGLRLQRSSPGARQP